MAAPGQAERERLQREQEAREKAERERKQKEEEQARIAREQKLRKEVGCIILSRPLSRFAHVAEGRGGEACSCGASRAAEARTRSKRTRERAQTQRGARRSPRS